MNSMLTFLGDDVIANQIAGIVAALLVLSAVMTEVLGRTKVIGEKRYAELRKRNYSWTILIALIAVPIFVGRTVTIGALLLLSIFCFREYSRATGLFRETVISAAAVAGIVLVFFAALDNWYGFFSALAPLTVVGIAATSIFEDRPQGFIQRVALGIFGFMFFGYSFAHLGFVASSSHYQSILLFIFFMTELNDILAYLCGSLFGKRKLCINTSPGKTIAGSVGALICTALLTVWLGGIVFAGTRLATIPLLACLGLVISSIGQLGDLVLSSVKRDIGVKDLGNILPGHGGLLDRFDSLTLVAPAAYHFIVFFGGLSDAVPARIFTAAWGS